jgi:hypothetical protein
MVSVLASNAVESGLEPGWAKDNKPTLAPSTNQHHQFHGPIKFEIFNSCINNIKPCLSMTAICSL